MCSGVVSREACELVPSSPEAVAAARRPALGVIAGLLQVAIGWVRALW